MAFNSTILRVMIASPSDVNPEREAIRQAISDWNVAHSSTRKVYLDAVGWDTHAVPEVGGRPQSFINKQLLDDCDILIAVFWTKIGSPTGEAVSGTAEELERHIKAGKPAMLYFSDKPVSLSKVDKAQHAALEAFKKSCQATSLYYGFDDLDDFKVKIRTHLAKTINDKFGSLKTPKDRSTSIKKTIDGADGIRLQQVKVELRLGFPFPQYTDQQQAELLNAIRSLLSVTDEVRIVARLPGSVRIIVETTPELAERLCDLAESEALLEHGVLGGRILPAQAPESGATDRLRAGRTDAGADAGPGETITDRAEHELPVPETNVVVITPMERTLPDPSSLPLFADLKSNLVVIDFSNVQFMSSLVLSHLLTLHKQCRSAGGRLALVGLPAETVNLFRLTKLDKIFQVYDSVPLAKERLSQK